LIEKEKINEEFKWITFEKFKYYLNLAIKNENTDYEKNDIENFIKTIENDLNIENSFLEDTNDTDEINHNISKNKHLEIEENDSNKSDENNSCSVSEESLSENALGSNEVNNNLDNMENFINSFSNINISENEIDIENDNVINSYYMQPLNKRVEKRMIIKKKEKNKKYNYPKKRRSDSYSDKEEKKRKSVSKHKKKAGNKIILINCLIKW